MVKQFLMNIMLTFVWVALTGHLNYANFFFGFALGFFILWLIDSRRNTKSNDRKYFNRVPKIIKFFLMITYDLLKANIAVTYEVVTPRLNMKPGIVQYTMDAKTDFEITMLSNLISLTPGTLIIDVSEDKKVLYIHAMHLSNKEKFIENIKNRIEKKLLEILR